METTLVPVSATVKKISEAKKLNKEELKKLQESENIVSTKDQAEVQNQYIKRQEDKIRNIGRTIHTGNMATQRARTSGLEFNTLDPRVEKYLKQENRQNRLNNQMKISQELKFMAKQQLFMG